MDRLKELVGSEARARVLSHFVADPGSDLHVRALERHIGITSRSLQLELERLERMGLLWREEAGRNVVYRRDDSDGWRAIEALIRSFGPLTLLRDIFANLEGVRGAFVFGSAAGGDVREGSDIDLLVFGDEIPDEAMGEALNAAYLALDRPLDVKRYDTEKLERELHRGRSFLPSALSGPQRWLVGSPDVLPELAAEVAA